MGNRYNKITKGIVIKEVSNEKKVYYSFDDIPSCYSEFLKSLLFINNNDNVHISESITILYDNEQKKTPLVCIRKNCYLECDNELTTFLNYLKLFLTEGYLRKDIISLTKCNDFYYSETINAEPERKRGKIRIRTSLDSFKKGYDEYKRLVLQEDDVYYRMFEFYFKANFEEYHYYGSQESFDPLYLSDEYVRRFAIVENHAKELFTYKDFNTCTSNRMKNNGITSKNKWKDYKKQKNYHYLVC